MIVGEVSFYGRLGTARIEYMSIEEKRGFTAVEDMIFNATSGRALDDEQTGGSRALKSEEAQEAQEAHGVPPKEAQSTRRQAARPERRILEDAAPGGYSGAPGGASGTASAPDGGTPAMSGVTVGPDGQMHLGSAPLEGEVEEDHAYGPEYADLFAFSPLAIILLFSLLPLAVQVSSLLAENTAVTVLVMMLLKYNVENFITVRVYCRSIEVHVL